MASIDFNQDPYFDDLDEAKKFLKILFRPRYAVQARELNQLQSLLNLQRERFGNHIFEDGAMVLPGYVSYDLDYAYIKCVSTVNLDSETYRETNFQDKIIVGSSGIKARVVNHLGTDGDNNVTFFVKYQKSNTAGTVGVFANGEVVTVEGTGITATLAASSATGVGCAAHIDDGIYYVKGYFIRVDKQTIILDAYTNTPSYRVGLVYTESIVEPEEDATLNDNAQGTPNEAAPGAHRYKVELVLTKLALDTVGEPEAENFYELLKLNAGVLDKIVTVTDYSELEKTLARRTFDESGDYTVRPFPIKVREHDSDDTKLTIDIDPGKAYVKGYEILKVGKTSVDIDKAREFARANNATIATPLGNYVRVNNLYGVPDITTYSKVTLYNKRLDLGATSTPAAPAGGTAIGTARVRDIRLESGTYGSSSAVYRVYLFDIDITNDDYNFASIKSLVDVTNKFASNIVLETYFPAEAGKNQTVTIVDADATIFGNGTLWTRDPNTFFQLQANDYIVVNGNLYLVSSGITDDTFETSPTPGPSDAVTGAPFGYVYARLYETNDNSLLYVMPQKYVRKIKSSDDTTVDTNYVVRREFTGLVVSGGSVTISTGDANSVFEPFSTSNYIVTYDTNLTHAGGVGEIVNVDAGDFSALPNSSVTISGLVNGETVRVIATVRNTQGSVSAQKAKALVTGASVNSAANERDLNVVSLGKADVYRVTKVYMKDGDYATAPTSSDVDITDRYDLDNGQRDNFYGLGRIILKPGARVPSGRLRIEFDYFTHSGGTYFSAESYVGAVDYEDIPSYSSPESGYVYSLRDCLDFRPRINDAGTAFDISTGSLSEFPIQGTVSADFSYYLNRIDKLYLDYRGSFHIVKGVPGVNPPAPEDPTEDGMVTHQINVRAYTIDPSKDVVVDYRENKRYTMRDIGKLERRIENLEYYTSLSLLEKETNDLEIKDENGLDRFKNGFVVDPFNGHGIGDVQNPDYKCAIDMREGIVRPQFVEDNVALELNAGSSLDYVKTGDLITLPYTHKVMIEQPLASNSVNVNPFNVLTFLGRINLDPPQDEWKDTETAPDLIVNHEGNFDSISQTVNGMGTIWNEWQDTWSGVTSSTTDVLSQLTFRSADPMLHRNLDGTVDTSSGLAGIRSRPGIDEWPVRQITITRTTNTVDTRQTRSGLRATVVPRTITENLGDKVINTAYIPFIRSRDVVFTAVGLKPNTRVYPFFDKVAVSSHVSPGATYTTPGGELITDATGKIIGTFRIPNSNSLRFRTGQRVFRLTSSSTDDPDNFTTAANVTYRAQGLLETKQATILSTRNAEVAWEAVSQDRVVTDTLVDLNVTDTNWIDPLAQTFLITKTGGAFVTKLELFFRKKDQNIPVTVQIREVVNGYPGQKVVPFGNVTVDAANIHTNDIVDGSLVIDGGAPDPTFGPSDFVPSVFTFPSPVYLKFGTEYCFVVMANTDAYELWVATFALDPVTGLPYTIVGSEIPVQAQPYGGSFFKSQNASTWTAVQEADIMFKLYQAEFEVGTTADLQFTNGELPVRSLSTNPLQTTEGSKLVRVSHPNHGMPNGSKVVIAGAASTAHGLLVGRINGTHTVANADLDSYTIDLATVTLTGISSTGTALSGGTNFLTTLAAGSGVRNSGGQVRRIASVTNNNNAVLESAFTVDLSSEDVTVVAGSTGTTGGSGITATQNRAMDLVHPVVGRMDFPDTTTEFYIKSTSGKSVDGSQTPYVIDTAYSPVIVNENIEFTSPRLIASDRNEEADVMVSGASKSFIMRVLMETTNENISPVIDVKRLSLITVANRLDSPTTSRNVDPLDYTTLVSANTTIAFNATTSIISTANAAAARALSTVRKGRYLVVTGATNPANNSTFRVTDVVYSSGGGTCSITVDGTLTTEVAGASVTVKYLEKFVSEYAPQHGSAASKYVCRRVLFSQPSNSLRIQMAANRPPTSTIDVYYKVSRIDDTTPFDEIGYEKATVDIDPGVSTNETDYRDYTYTINNLGEFNSVAVKIVFGGTDTTQVPTVTDFRCIGLAT